MRKDYSQIKSIEELEAAQREVSAEIAAHQQKVASGDGGPGKSFAFSNILSSGVRTFARRLPYDTLLLWLLKYARRRFFRSK